MLYVHRHLWQMPLIHSDTHTQVLGCLLGKHFYAGADKSETGDSAGAQVH